jgi:CTP:molybdopterin cytidylyltransferase MocA
MQPERLAEFVKSHPDPSVSAVLALADRPSVDGDTRARIARWLEANDTDSPPIEDLPGGDPRAAMWGGGE